MPLLATVLGLSRLGSCGGLLVASFSAASLLYIAMSDLIPDLHRGQVDGNSMRQVVLIGAGVATIVAFERLVG